MTERNEVIRDAFQDDSLGPSDRDRLWSTMQQRQARHARLRYLARAGVLLLAGALIAAVVFLRGGRGPADRRLAGPVVIAADSLSTNFPSEPSMIQDPPREDVPSNLIPLLGHRSSLTMDIARYEAQIDALARRVNQTSGVEHDVVTRQLSAAEHQLEATKAALAAVDRELSGHQGTVTEYVSIDPNTTPQVFQFGGPGIPNEVMYVAGGAGGLLLLGMLSLLVYLRHFARSTREALSLVERQVSSQHATLASGIDAIALEVERLGEGQRFMSKALATPEKARAHD